MNDPPSLDELRDLLDGRLPSGAADALRARIAADATLRADFERLREVHDLTAAAAAVPPCGVTWDDIAPRARVVPLRRWAAAAALVAAVGAGVAAGVWFTRPVPRTVDLAVLHISASAPAVDGPPEPIPESLDAYEPVRDGRVNWIASWEEGAALARASGKAMFVYVFHPTCPWCRELDGRSFRDPDVRSRIAEFVPVRLDVTTASADVERRLAAGWPYLAAIEADGTTIREVPGVWRLADVRPAVRAAEEAAAAVPRPTWAEVRQATADLARARDAEREGRLAEAWSAARSAVHAAPSSAPGHAGASIAAGLEGRASAAVAAAMRTAADDVARAAATVEAEAALFAGTPPGDDLAAVARAIREGRSFPVLREAPTPGDR